MNGYIDTAKTIAMYPLNNPVTNNLTTKLDSYKAEGSEGDDGKEKFTIGERARNIAIEALKVLTTAVVAYGFVLATVSLASSGYKVAKEGFSLGKNKVTSQINFEFSAVANDTSAAIQKLFCAAINNVKNAW